MITYQNLLSRATSAKAHAREQLDELQLAVTNLRNEIEHAFGAPQGDVCVAQGNPGALKVVQPSNLTYTEENTICFHLQVRLVGARGVVATLAVPATISRTEASILIIVEDSDPYAYQAGSNSAVVKLIGENLAWRADEVGV
ncbi:hypothetical protein PQR39_26135 [Paraburkholderia sediminicola]|uniref:hypothetical protein n=1 Tax=Paraburkholderia sediminicola TaxID=458836 RepID=UPI0038BCE5BB